MALSKITTRALANDSVTADKVADNAITTDMVASGEIGVTDLADGSITNAKVSSTAAIAASKVDLSSIAGNVDLASGALQIGGNTVINSSRQAFFTAATGSSLKLERSDVGHGMTAIAETATFGHLTAEGGANGGLRITALADTASTSAFNVSAYAHTPSTDGNAAVIRLRGSKKNGTGEQAIADSEDLLSIGNVGTERIIVKGNGDFQVNGTTVINSSQVGFLNEKTRIGTGATYPTDNAQLYIQRSNNNPYIGFFSNDGSRNAYLQSNGSGAFYLNNAEGGGWAFNNSTSDVLSISNSGTLTATSAEITAGNSLKLQNVAGNGYATIQNAGAGTNTDLGFSTGGSTRMTITSDGHIGIGDGSTDSLMARTSQGYLSTRVKNFNITSGGSAYAFTGVNIYQDTSGQYKYIDAAASSSIHYWGDAMQFHLAPSGAADATMAASEKMRLTSAGSMGISTDNPDAKLHVVGNTKLGSASSASWTNSLNDAGGLDIFVGSGSKALTVWDDNRQGAPRFQVDRDGQVGIGRAPTSTFKLDVHNSLSGNWLAHFENTHNSNGYGVKIRAGDDGNVTSFRVSNYDNTNTLLNVYGDGTVTKPNTPAFHGKRNSTLSNPAANTPHDLSFVSERFDQGNNFNGSLFTAPVTGKYYLAVNLRLEQLQTNASFYQVYITTSNEAYQITLDPNFSANLDWYGVAYSVLADLDGGDTAKIQWYQLGGSTGADINISSYFCGHLVA